MKTLNIDFNINITITMSKIFAFVVIALATIIDFKSKSNGTIFMFSVPFACGLITGKQAIDYLKTRKTKLKQIEV